MQVGEICRKYNIARPTLQSRATKLGIHRKRTGYTPSEIRRILRGFRTNVNKTPDRFKIYLVEAFNAGTKMPELPFMFGVSYRFSSRTISEYKKTGMITVESKINR